jgi:hypothetical protein
MSSIIIRNVVGQGAFAIPTSEAAADAATNALQTLLDTITWLYYDDAKIMLVHPQNDPTPEMVFIIDTFFYLGSIIPTTNALRAALNAALLNEADIVSIGDINIDQGSPGDIFHHQWPEIEWIDSTGGSVQFTDTVPAGAQIELAKYTRWKPGVHFATIYPLSDRLGKRYHRFLRLGVGERNISLSPWVNSSGRFRNAFRARYVWPESPGTLAPAHGVVGPLAPYGLVTTILTEQTGYNLGVRLLMTCAPSMFKKP